MKLISLILEVSSCFLKKVGVFFDVIDLIHVLIARVLSKKFSKLMIDLSIGVSEIASVPPRD